MSDEELNTLAEDIKANGLVHPIVVGKVDGKDVIIDGRNRLKACEIAGVEPSFTSIEDRDPKEFILSVNVNRRHMSSGQRAMATAMIYPEPERGGRGKKATETIGFSSQRLSYARTVLADSRSVAEQVLSGEVMLDDAYAGARARIRAKQDDDRQRFARLFATSHSFNPPLFPQP
ncbi:MAG: ParB/RepB/Spo0J family partition protein [Xanthobacteraceae bacterium]|nr:ParB/RepB/Spo0J family partition protein [Xanthobacteraceae bacterium]